MAFPLARRRGGARAAGDTEAHICSNSLPTQLHLHPHPHPLPHPAAHLPPLVERIPGPVGVVAGPDAAPLGRVELAGAGLTADVGAEGCKARAGRRVEHRGAGVAQPRSVTRRMTLTGPEGQLCVGAPLLCGRVGRSPRREAVVPVSEGRVASSAQVISYQSPAKCSPLTSPPPRRPRPRMPPRPGPRRRSGGWSGTGWSGRPGRGSGGARGWWCPPRRPAPG